MVISHCGLEQRKKSEATALVPKTSLPKSRAICNFEAGRGGAGSGITSITQTTEVRDGPL